MNTESNRPGATEETIHTKLDSPAELPKDLHDAGALSRARAQVRLLGMLTDAVVADIHAGDVARPARDD